MQLLQFRTNPNLCEDNGPKPILWAIRVASAEYVQQLIDHRADPLATEVVYMEDHVQLLIDYNVDRTAARTAAPAIAGATHTQNVLLTRTTFEAAASMPRILHAVSQQ